jgi:hypothetical protein
MKRIFDFGSQKPMSLTLSGLLLNGLLLSGLLLRSMSGTGSAIQAG